MKWFLSALLAFTFNTAWSADIFVADPIVQDGISPDDSSSIRHLVQNTVSTNRLDRLVNDQTKADYVLQPRLMRLGDSFILTVERRQGEQIQYASQMKAQSLNEIDRAARRATLAAMSDADRSSQRKQTSEEDALSRSASSSPLAKMSEPAPYLSSSRPGYQLNPAQKQFSYWNVGFGPALGRRMESDDVFYSLSVARIWDIHPRISAKALGEANFTSGNEAYLYNVGIGASWFFFPSVNGTAYVTGDLGYGFAQSTLDNTNDGFTFGTGVGYQFFRTSRTTLDVLFRYAVLTSDLEENGFPQIFGARLAVNF